MSETRKLAAILVADIVGYSRLAAADEDRILARLRTLRSDLIDPTNSGVHNEKAWLLASQGRFEEAIVERERTLDLDPADVGAIQGMAWDHLALGHFEKGLELFDKAIRLSPRDPQLRWMDQGKGWSYFGLKEYDQAIDWTRRAIAVEPNNPFPHANLAAALALTGHEAEAREALQRYLALPSSAQNIAEIKAFNARFTDVNRRVLDSRERLYEGLRKAGMPEGEAKTN